MSTVQNAKHLLLQGLDQARWEGLLLAACHNQRTDTRPWATEPGRVRCGVQAHPHPLRDQLNPEQNNPTLNQI
jgi:hypothetical protein